MPPLLIRKIKTVARQPLFVWLWILPVWIFLGITKTLIFTVSFKRLYPWLGQKVAVAPWSPLLTDPQQKRAQQIGRVVRMMAKYTPWNSNCFPQAVTARLLLGLYRVPYVLCFGVRRDAAGQPMQAHAWVVSGRIHVTGGDSFSRFTTVAMFASPHAQQGK